MTSKTAQEFNDKRERQNEIVMKYAGQPLKRFYSLDNQVYKDGELDPKTKELLGLVASLVLRCDEDLGGYYQVRLEPANRRFVFDRWPRPGDQPFMLERPLAMDQGGRVDLEVILDGSIVEIYTSNRVAMSTRAYDSGEGNLGLFVSEGSAVFEGTEISVL